MKFAKTEALFILLLFFGAGLWMVSKCSARRSEISMRNRAEFERAEREDASPAPRPQPAPLPKPPVAAPPAESAPTRPDPAPAPKTLRPSISEQAARAEGLTRLYVTLENLNVRKTPAKNGALVTRLKLDEEVFFLNEKSSNKETVNLGKETVTDYWVKIRTQSGKEGWVFGAGVHYFKTRRDAPQ